MHVTPIARTWHPALHIENHPEPTPRPAALDHLDPRHDGRIYRYYAGHLGSITLPRAGGHVFDGLTPATGRDWHDAAFATGIYRCADRGMA